MRTYRQHLGLWLLTLALAGTAAADLLVTDRYRDSIHLFSSVDGSLIQLDFITDASGADLDSALEALVAGDEIWVADQNNDAILRYNRAGQFLAYFVDATDAIDNIRGFDVIGGVVYVTNFGTANGAPGAAIRKFDVTTGADLGSVFPPGARSPWDVMNFHGRILVSDDTAISISPPSDTGAVWELLPGGGTSVFATGSQSTNGLSLPKQMITLSNGNLLIGNNGTPRALLEYSAAGVQLVSYSTGTLRANGIYELDNGLIFIAGEDTGVSTTNGIYLLDRSNGQVHPVLVGSQVPGGLLPHYAQYIAPRLCPGDMNCDGAVNFQDINKFVEALGGQAAWDANPANAGCPWLNGDVNGDGNVTFGDINPFVAQLGVICP